MNSQSGVAGLIEREEAVNPRPGAAFEVVRIKLTDYAHAALGVQVHSIPAASSVVQESIEQPREHVGAAG